MQEFFSDVFGLCIHVSLWSLKFESLIFFLVSHLFGSLRITLILLI
uniref:ORF45a n=1 Tax=Pinus koraiensis TaxID=88728 RepID=A4QMJ8_PINKO|nr:ORF45a [Pinus koraiensis]ABP35348.1 ORF45a [Pinus koraiensis]